MKFGSLFSGIEAASVAWKPLGWRCAWVAEIDPFASAVLRHHYPDTPNLGDVNRIDAHAIEPVDLVVFGSPCQSFSVAGKRLGLDDPRGNMALVGLRVVGAMRPRWVVWENVPGVLSSDGGRDFGAFLGLLGELGYGFAYRVFDAQHFGVPQRRRRVFVVGCLGDWRGAVAVLFEPESLRGDPAPSREAGERTAADAVVGALQSGGTPNGHGTAGINRQAVNAGHLIAFGGNNQTGAIEVATAVRAKGGTGHGDFESETFVCGTIGAENVGHTTGMESGADLLVPVVFESRFARNGRGAPDEIVPPLKAQSDQSGKGDAAPLLAVLAENGSDVQIGDGQSTGAISTGQRPGHADNIFAAMSVRRLLPVECEKLQGLPPGYTDVPYRGKPAADGPRYRAIGNGFAIPVVRYIGERIALFEEATQ